jgi:hypothetical protein
MLDIYRQGAERKQRQIDVRWMQTGAESATEIEMLGYIHKQ